jgi:phosphoribosyl-ATP pyrophosphohydrolase
MIIPSIDIMNGRAVQLVGGREFELDAGDPRPIAERFALAGEIAVVDLDAALGRGSNAEIIRELLRIAACRVGGGIRSVAQAVEWLDAGATKVVLGTAAVPEVLASLPPERVIAALDAVNGEVVVEGWQSKTGRSVVDRMAELSPFVGGFLVTAVEREGRMAGCELETVAALVALAGAARVTIAGGITCAAEIAALDQAGADAQVGMALYKNHLSLAEALAAPLRSDRPDGLWPTVVVDEQGLALGLAYSSMDSLRQAIETRRGVYHSRTRGLWVKGAASGQTQQLLHVDLDCDRDALRFTVRQAGTGFCHRATYTCWGPARGLAGLQRTLRDRRDQAPPGSYSRRLFDDAGLLNAKLVEEAGELAAAGDREHVAEEAADVLYFTLAAMTRAGVTLGDVEQVLDRRGRKITRRPGDAKTRAQP